LPKENDQAVSVFRFTVPGTHKKFRYKKVTSQTMTESKTIVFIHGLFMNPTGWEPWIKYFTLKGYTCYAPAFPHHEGKPGDLRRNIHPQLPETAISDVVKSLVRFIDGLPEKPILIGHSVGGFVTQKLMELGKGVAGICIDSAPPAGIMTWKWSFWKANLPVINPFQGNSPFLPSVEWFQHAFCNTMTMEETQKVYDQFVVPESRTIPRSMLTDSYGKINFRKPHSPLLFIAGEQDNIIPASLNLTNFKAYKDKNSIRQFKEFAGRTHFICGQKKGHKIFLGSSRFYAKSFWSLKRKNFWFVTPLRLARNSLILALKDSANALVDLSKKKLRMVSKWFRIVLTTELNSCRCDRATFLNHLPNNLLADCMVLVSYIFRKATASP
jgi:pimeloyl-ACP methyl ester carboxylesterase